MKLRRDTVVALQKHLDDKHEEGYLLGYSSWKARSDEQSGAGEVDVHITGLHLTQYERIHGWLAENVDLKSPAYRLEKKAELGLRRLIVALRDPENKKYMGDVRGLVEVMETFFLKNAERYENCFYLLEQGLDDMKGIAYLPLHVEYHHAVLSRDESEWVSLELAYWHGGQYRTRTVSFDHGDLRQTIPEMLSNRANMTIMTPELREEWARVMEQYWKAREWNAEQVWVRRQAPAIERGRNFWFRAENRANLTIKGRPSKGVIDVGVQEDIEERDNFTNRRKNQHSRIYAKSMEVPIHPVLPIFSLAHHEYYWVNVLNIKKYKYEEDLGSKLILPKSHRNLVAALVWDLEVLKDEGEAEEGSRTIKNKASANIILAYGPPGTGKTLTGEVYAEEMKRPLYEVAAGQIGTDPEEIEKNLNVILERSIRLQMPLLINEADVFIRKRGTDIIQNAVCAVFLRLTEYHDGLIFLTTNLGEDVDHAMRSRCIAEIEYGIPETEERGAIWRVLLAEFNQTLSDQELEQVVGVFPQVVGRDIQNLIRLTSRVCKSRKEEFNLKAMVENSVFKRIHVDETVVPQLTTRKKK